MLLDITTVGIQEILRRLELNWHVAVVLNKWVWKWWERKQQAKAITSSTAITTNNPITAFCFAAHQGFCLCTKMGILANVRQWQPSQALVTSREAFSCQALLHLLPWWNNKKPVSFFSSARCLCLRLHKLGAVRDRQMKRVIEDQKTLSCVCWSDLTVISLAKTLH